MNNKSVLQIKQVQIQKLHQIINQVVEKYIDTKHKRKLSNYVVHILIRLYAGFSHHIKVRNHNQLNVLLTLCKLHIIKGHLSTDEKNMQITLTKTGKKLGNKYFTSSKRLHKQLHRKDINAKIGTVIAMILFAITAGVFFVGAFSMNSILALWFIGLLCFEMVCLGSIELYLYHYILNPNRLNQKQLIAFLSKNTNMSKSQILYILGQSYYKDLKVIKHKQPDYTYKFFKA